MKKRLLACVLSCLLVLHLSVPALAADGLDYLEDDIGVLPAETVPEDIVVNPEDYIINSGASVSSLGLTLSMGQIAALIAGGVGTVYLASNWDALGSHLQTALNEAASLNGGAAALTYWLENARQGVIALSSAPVWITQTILNACYNIHQGLAYPTASPFGQYAPQSCGTVVPAGSPVFIGIPNVSTNDGSISRSYLTYSVPVVVFNFFNYSPGSTSYSGFCSTLVMSVNDSSSGLSYANVYVDSVTGIRRYWSYAYNGMIDGNSVAAIEAFENFCLPGAILYDSYGAVPSSVSTKAFSEYLSTGVVGGLVEYPSDVSVCPDALVGGISQAWTNDTLGADVIDLPDILIDGSGVITGTDTATLDTSISTTLDKVATGELAWDDYWIDIANSIPVAKVEDTTTGDVVERPIAPDGTLQDPVVVPDWSTDPHDYTIDLTRFFPFCIPFDLYDFFSCLIADPEAPVFDLEIPLLGQSYGFRVDLSSFDDVAQLVRNLELFLFIIMLAVTTRDNMIKG